MQRGSWGSSWSSGLVPVNGGAFQYEAGLVLVSFLVTLVLQQLRVFVVFVFVSFLYLSRTHRQTAQTKSEFRAAIHHFSASGISV